MPSPGLSGADRRDLVRILRDVIQADRWPHSPRVRRMRELLGKLAPPAVEKGSEFPAPRQGERSMVRGKRQR